MKRLMVMLALVPVLAAAAPSGQATQSAPKDAAPAARPGAPGAPGAGPGTPDPAFLERVQKRMRVATTVGLAEALDLDEAGAIRVRDVLARQGERRAPVMRQVRDNVRILRDAARGDQAAAGQVDAALAKLRDARGQLQTLDNETFQQLTQGLSPEKKAKAALFLARFRERMRGHMAQWQGEGGRGGMMHGPGMRGPGRGEGWGPGPGMRGRGPGTGPGFGPTGGQMTPPQLDPSATAMGPLAEPDFEGDWFADE